MTKAAEASRPARGSTTAASESQPGDSTQESVEESTQESVAHLMKRVVLSIAQQADRQLSIWGLTSTQWSLLVKLRNGAQSTVADLARECQIDAGSMTRLLDRLEKKKLCRRARSTVDRRVVQVELTPDGKAAVAQVHGLCTEVLDAHLAGFTAAEGRALRRYLQRMLQAGEAMRAKLSVNETIKTP